MDDAARTVAKCMEDEPGEMTRQEIIDEVAFTLLDEVAEYFDTYHGKLEPRLLDMIDPNVREGHTARVRLQPDETRVWVDAGWISADGITGGPTEPSGFLAVEPDDIVLIVHIDLIAVPLPRRELLVVLIILLPGFRAQRLNLVDSSSPAEE
jgi:hypothetical protein